MKIPAEKREYEEIRIKVPWGFLAGKWYGPKDDRPILALHGWQDNANTFDTLIPLMPSYVGVLCVDLPGHGVSSCFPDGMIYHAIDYLQCILRIMREYNWTKVSLIGHSLCAMLSFVFASFYPDKVDLVISIDLLTPLYRTPAKDVITLRYKFDKFLKADQRNRTLKFIEPPTYSYKELLTRFYEGWHRSIDYDKCDHILLRNIKKSTKYPDKYYFARDERIKFYDEFLASPEFAQEMASRIRAPFLYIKGLASTFLTNNSAVVEILQKTGRFKQVVIANGTHHLHLNQPEELAPHINWFIQKYRPPAFQWRSKL